MANTYDLAFGGMLLSQWPLTKCIPERADAFWMLGKAALALKSIGCLLSKARNGAKLLTIISFEILCYLAIIILLLTGSGNPLSTVQCSRIDE